jgi:hypothetical protein
MFSTCDNSEAVVVRGSKRRRELLVVANEKRCPSRHYVIRSVAGLVRPFGQDALDGGYRDVVEVFDLLRRCAQACKVRRRFSDAMDVLANLSSKLCEPSDIIF